MSDTFFGEKLNWKAHGYFAQSSHIDDHEPEAALWSRVQDVLEQAKAGHFANIEELLDIYDASSGILKSVCIRILGDAGTDSCFAGMIPESLNPLDPTRGCDYASAFHAWGSLSVVPVLCQLYDSFYGYQEAEVLPLFFSSLLEPEWGPLSRAPMEAEIEAYLAGVMDQYEALKVSLGTDQVPVLHGAVFGVLPLAKLLLRHLDRSAFAETLQTYGRRKFEAATGINCTGFFKEGIFQPLSAAVILEDFVDSPAAQSFQDGVRYFFGHRIPG